MYDLKINSEVIHTIYDLPTGKRNWLHVAEFLGDDLSAASIKISISKPASVALMMAEVCFMSHTAFENQVAAEVNGPEEILGHNAVQGVALHIDRSDDSNCDEVKQAVGHVKLNEGVELVVDLLPHPHLGSYSSKDLWRFQYYLIHIKKALDHKGMCGSALPEPVYLHMLKKKYDLSQAESRLLISVYHSSCLKTSASLLKRSYHTVRSQMKSILKKTNSPNQLALFKQLMTQ